MYWLLSYDVLEGMTPVGRSDSSMTFVIMLSAESCDTLGSAGLFE